MRNSCKTGGTAKKKYEKGGVITGANIIEGPRRKVAGSNMAKGGSLKPVNPSANPGLAKLPTEVRNKMGYAKNGGGKTGTPPMSTKEALAKVFTGKMTAAQANAATGYGTKPKKYTDAQNKENLGKIFSGTHVQDAQGNIVPKVNKTGGKKKMGGSVKHPGFKAVKEKIAKKQGISSKAAAAILAAASRNASPSAKKKNPRLKKVKG